MASTGAILSLAGGQAGAFDVTRELSPVSLIAAPPYIVVANPAVPARDTAESIAYAKASPGKLTFGSSGAGSASHLSGALFGQMAGVEMLHLPYRGTGPAVTDLLGGRIDLMFSPALVVTPLLAAGTLRVMGVTARRARHCSGFSDDRGDRPAGYQSLGWFGPVGAGGHAARDRRQGQRRRRPGAVCRTRDQRLAEQGAEPAPNTPEAFTAFVNADIAKWLDLAAKAGIGFEPLVDARAIEAVYAGTRLGWCKWRMTSLGPVSRPRRHGREWTRSSTNARRTRQGRTRSACSSCDGSWRFKSGATPRSLRSLIVRRPVAPFHTCIWSAQEDERI